MPCSDPCPWYPTEPGVAAVLCCCWTDAPVPCRDTRALYKCQHTVFPRAVPARTSPCRCFLVSTPGLSQPPSRYCAGGPSPPTTRWACVLRSRSYGVFLPAVGPATRASILFTRGGCPPAPYWRNIGCYIGAKPVTLGVTIKKGPRTVANSDTRARLAAWKEAPNKSLLLYLVFNSLCIV